MARAIMEMKKAAAARSNAPLLKKNRNKAVSRSERLLKKKS